MVDAVEVSPGVRIPDEEIRLRFSRSGGPGGQHANTSATKVQLRFDLEASAALTEEQKALARERLASRLTAEGELVLESSEYRSQTRNREAVVARFASLLADALRAPRKRRATRRPKSAEERRLRAKRARSERKQLRKPPDVG